MLARFCAFLLVAALLAACAGQPASPNDFPPRPTDAPQAAALASATTSRVPKASATPDAQPATATPPAASPTRPAPTFTEPPAPTNTVAAPAASATPIAQNATATSADASPATPTAPAITPTTGPSTISAEIFFLRGGALVAYGVATRAERTIAPSVREFAAAPDGRALALVRGEGAAAELWVVGRDGAGLRQLTRDDRADGSPVFAPDGLALAYASSSATKPRGTSWDAWSQWCAASEVRVVAIGGGQSQTLGKGCDPAFSPNGKRIAFAAAPTAPPAEGINFLGSKNTIRIVNRQGQNGWSYASAGDTTNEDSGLVVYAPAFDVSGDRLAYQRFFGERALTDLDYTQIGGSYSKEGHKPINMGFGWLDAPRFAPGGALVAISQNNFGDARGLTGYEVWEARVLRLPGQRQVASPSGQLALASDEVARLPRAQRAAWSPDGATLAVQLPSGWSPSSAPGEPLFTDETSGELWRWVPGQQPAERLAQNVDFASPILWLAAP